MSSCDIARLYGVRVLLYRSDASQKGRNSQGAFFPMEDEKETSNNTDKWHVILFNDSF